MMHKSLVALSAFAACAANAQSSVTLFGVLDASISHYAVGRASSTAYSATTGLRTMSSTPARSQTVLGNGTSVSSRLGFRGTEDLGGGLAASFWLEAPLSNDDGSATRTFTFSRRSTVSLSGPFGEVRLGRDYVPSFYNDSVFDPFATNGVGTNLINQTSLVNRSTHAILSGDPNYNRANNSLGYLLPPDLGGIYGQAMHAFHENIKTEGQIINGAPTDVESTRGRYVGGRLGYAKGPLDIAVAYGVSTLGNFSGTFVAPYNPANLAAAYDAKVKTANLGASYDFGVVKLMGEISSVRTGFDQPALFNGAGALSRAAVSDSADSLGFLIAGQIPVGPGQIKLAYSRVKTDLPNTLRAVNGAAPALVSTPSPTVDKIAIGYVHNLSKRTALYAQVARVDNKNDSFILGLNGNSNSSVPITGAPNSRNWGYDLGLRHSF